MQLLETAKAGEEKRLGSCLREVCLMEQNRLNELKLGWKKQTADIKGDKQMDAGLGSLNWVWILLLGFP